MFCWCFEINQQLTNIRTQGTILFGQIDQVFIAKIAVVWFKYATERPNC